MRKYLLNLVFAAHLVFVALVLTGVLSRQLVFYEICLLSVYLIYASLEEGIMFFVRCIPIFIAVPLTASYDNLNMWRIFAILLFFKWLFTADAWRYMVSGLMLLYKKPRVFIREHPWLALFHVLLIFTLASLWHAGDPVMGFKRILYFINATLIGIVISYPPRTKEFFVRLVKNITIPVIIVSLVGVIQLVSTYFIDIYQFMRIWGEDIQMREFGAVWSYIAVHVGNTWLAYYGDQLSLRIFSLFPDSHSFPIFLLLGLPAFFAWTLARPISKASSFKDMLRTRGKLALLWIPLIFLLMILTGTRGIWAGGIAMLIWVPIVLWWLRRGKAGKEHRNIFLYLASYLIAFFMLFSVAYPIFSSPQFLLSKGDAYLLRERFRSIFDFGETSNGQRIEIWKKSLVSIGQHPLLGVGIGNFPVVLAQNIQLSKAGSSAHNIYLHVAAEMGLAAFLLFIWFIWLTIKAIADQFIRARDPYFLAYFGGLLITFPWVLVYLMTDVAIFDERALLLCVVTLAVISNTRTSHA